MKIKTFTLQLLGWLLVCATIINTACNYDEIVDAPYPPAKIYLPIAVEEATSAGIYLIEDGASTSWASPTPGQDLKYSVIRDEDKFIIPLGIYRSGIEKSISGAANVSVSFDTDTIQALIASGKLDGVEMLPLENMQLPVSVKINGGKNQAQFDLTVNLGFLRAAAPKKYATAITISGEEANINQNLCTGIIVIDTRITIPEAAFESHPVGSSADTYEFTNKSLYWDYFSGEDAFSWDFGDGSTLSSDISPQHTYASPGEYYIKLTVKGITGETTVAKDTILIK